MTILIGDFAESDCSLLYPTPQKAIKLISTKNYEQTSELRSWHEMNPLIFYLKLSQHKHALVTYSGTIH